MSCIVQLEWQQPCCELKLWSRVVLPIWSALRMIFRQYCPVAEGGAPELQQGHWAHQLPALQHPRRAVRRDQVAQGPARRRPPARHARLRRRQRVPHQERLRLSAIPAPWNWLTQLAPAVHTTSVPRIQWQQRASAAGCYVTSAAICCYRSNSLLLCTPCPMLGSARFCNPDAAACSHPDIH